MKKLLVLTLILLLTAALAEPADFEYSYVSGTACCFFDADAHMLVRLSDGGQIEVTRYSGDFDLFVYIGRGESYDLFYLRNEDTAVLRTGETERLYTPIAPSEAENILKQANFTYDPEDYYIREVVITQGTNARTKPDYSGTTVQWLYDGDRFPYLETKGVWYKLTLPNGKEAWVPAERAKVEVR